MAEQKSSSVVESKVHAPLSENTVSLRSDEFRESTDEVTPLRSKYGNVRKLGKSQGMEQKSTDESKTSNVSKVVNRSTRGESCFTRPTTTPEYDQILQDIHSGKASSTNTVYASSTISAPCAEEIILSVSTAFHSQMVYDASDLNEYLTEAMFEFFVEKDFFVLEGEDVEMDEGKSGNEAKTAESKRDSGSPPRKRQRKLTVPIPSLETVFRFFQHIIASGEIGPESLIVALIYINRLSANTQIPLHASNWRPLLLSAVILAQKMWDDRTLQYQTFSEILPGFGLEKHTKFADLELKFLQMLRYDVLIDTSLYAKYYFDLRALSESQGGSVANLPLNKAGAKRLEIRSRAISESYQTKTAN